MADPVPSFAETLDMGGPVPFAAHRAALGAGSGRRPAFAPAFLPPPAPPGPPIAAPWASPFRLSPGLRQRDWALSAPPWRMGLPAAVAEAELDPVAVPDPAPAWEPPASVPGPAAVLPELPAPVLAPQPLAEPPAPAAALPAPALPSFDVPQRRPGFRTAAPAVPRRRFGRRQWAMAAAIVLIPLAGTAIFLALPRLVAPPAQAGMPGVFNAPIMVLRAKATGRVHAVEVGNGQAVEPGTVLMTIQTESRPDPAAGTLRARLDTVRDRLAALDAIIAGPPPTTDAARARLADTRRQRAAAAAEQAQLQTSVAGALPEAAAEIPVRAGLTGRVWSIDATPGTDTAPDQPLIRLVDCGHPFVVPAKPAELTVGQAVEVRIAGLAPFPGTVRPSAGVAEPAGMLVVDPARQTGPGSCPVGMAATIAPRR